MSLNSTGGATWMIALLICSACSSGDGEGSRSAEESSTATGAADTNPVSNAGDDTTSVGTAGAEDGQVASPAASATRADSGVAPTPVCVPPEGPLPANATLLGREGDFRLTMVEQVAGSPARSAEGSLVLLAQVDSLREFQGNAGSTIPGVTAPLFGSTDLNVESVGAVRVGSLSSQDPASPGVLVIESETGASPSILLRFGSVANRRDLVRFDGGYTVLTVEEITTRSFGGTWSSGTRGPGSTGFFCATPSG